MEPQIENTACNSRINCIALFVGLAVFLLDQLSKFFVASALPLMDHHPYVYPYGGIGIFSHFLGIEFSITHATNTGAAWGMLNQYQVPLTVLRVFLIGGTILYFLFYNKRPAWQIPLALIIAGAVGNLIDFFTYGHVVDMFHFILWGYDFPVFNIADSAISIGVGSLLLLSWLE